MWFLLSTAWAGDWSWAPMPIGDYSTDHGFGYGGYVLAVRRAEPDDEDYTLRLGLQLFWSTGKYRNHWLQVEAPSIAGSGWSLEAEAGWEAWEFAPYYGHGNAVEVLRDADPLYNTYDIASGYALSNVRRDLFGDWDAFATLLYRPARVSPRPETRLSADQPIGMWGGRVTRVGVGVLHDTRSGLPSPHGGHASELSVRSSQPWLGSEFQSFGVTAADRRYRRLGVESLVVATQLIGDVQLGEDPFFMSHVLGGSRWLTLGGPDLLRGFPQGRFRGDAAAVAAVELRWTVHRLGVRDHTLDLVPVPFAESGRVWARGEQDVWWHVHADAGLGLRFVWDEDLVIRWDTAVGLEEYADGSRGPVLGMWFMFDHPF